MTENSFISKGPSSATGGIDQGVAGVRAEPREENTMGTLERPAAAIKNPVSSAGTDGSVFPR